MRTTVKIFDNPTTEAQHQTNVIRWSQLKRGAYPQLSTLFHIPNGGGRDAIEGKHLKDQGVKAGVPDLCLPVPMGEYHGLYIELKRPGGRLSVEQAWWRDRLTENGYISAVCYGWESAVKIIEWYLKGASQDE